MTRPFISTVVKTSIIYKNTHLLASFKPNKMFYKRSYKKDMIFQYVWNSKTDRIGMNNIIQNIENGGLKIIIFNPFVMDS